MERDDGSAVEIHHGRGRIHFGKTRLHLFGGLGRVKRLISLQTFAELEAMLQGDERFLPCNRGVLVNMDEALKLDGDSIILMNGMRFPIRQRNRLEMVNRFSEYQIRRMKRG